MDINDDALRALWQRQQPPPGLAATMAGKVQRHRRLAAVRVTVEIAVTVAGIALLTWPAADGHLSAGNGCCSRSSRCSLLPAGPFCCDSGPTSVSPPTRRWRCTPLSGSGNCAPGCGT